MLLLLLTLCIIAFLDSSPCFGQYTNTSSTKTSISCNGLAPNAYIYSSTREPLGLFTTTATSSWWDGSTTTVTTGTTTISSYRNVYVSREDCVSGWSPPSTISTFDIVYDTSAEGLRQSSRASSWNSESSVSNAWSASRSASCMSVASVYNASKNLKSGSYDPPNDCCWAENPCTIYADQVQILYWPSATANQTVASTLVSDGYTFVSPSIYGVYNTLSAEQGGSWTCIGGPTTSIAALGPGMPLGPVHTSITQAYSGGELFTMCHDLLAGVYPLNPTDLATPVANSVLFQQGKCIEFFAGISPANGTDLAASPMMLLPTRVKSVDPAWSTCVGFVQGVWDPPKTLRPMEVLAPAMADPGATTTKPAASSPILQTPSPLASPTTPIATQTLNPTTSTIPPRSTDPQGGITPSQTAKSLVGDPANAAGDPGSRTRVSATNQPSNSVNDAGNVEPDPTQLSSKESTNIIQTVIQDPGSGESLPGQSPAGQSSKAPNHVNDDPQTLEAGLISLVESALQDPGGSSSSSVQLPAVGGQQISIVQMGGVVVGGATILPGSAAKLGTQQVSVGSGRIVVDSNTYTLPPAAPTLLQGAGQQVQSLPSGVVLSAGTTISAFGPAVTISGSALSVLPGGSNLLINGENRGTPILESGQKLSSNGAVGVGTITLSAGGPAATILGSVMSVLPSGNGILINSQTDAISTAAAGSSGIGLLMSSKNPASHMTIAGHLIRSQADGAIAIGSKTLSPGGPAATVSGIVLSVLPSNGGLLVDGQTQTLPATSVPQSVFAVGEQTFTANPSAFSVAGTTIRQGESGVTISGTPVSLGPSGLVLGSSTIPLFTSNAQIPPPQTVFTVGGQIFTPNPSAFSIAGTTLRQGGSAVTILGTPVSLGPSRLFIGSSTIPLIATSTGGLGEIIASAFSRGGEATTSGPSASVLEFTATGGRFTAQWWTFGLFALLWAGIGAQGMYVY